MLTNMYHQWRKILYVAPIMLILPMSIASENKNQDVLVYTVNNEDGSKSPFMLYDPQTHMSTPVQSNSEDGLFLSSFTVSEDGRLAFSSEEEGNADIYVKDVLSPDSTPINITAGSTANDYPEAWSPDGHYLAFTSFNEDKNVQIYVWDGKATVNITPENLAAPPDSYGEASWSFDGRLAFVQYYLFAGLASDEHDDGSEIYLWDGTATTNLSQNPTGEDRSPTWNTKGELAFTSWRAGNDDILIWDGVSLKNGSPDSDTFINVLPELTDKGAPSWTTDNHLAFAAYGSQDERLQIYKWDGQTATNISQNPTQENVGTAWSNDGRWASSTFQQSLYVKNAENHTLLEVEGEYMAWSPGGYFIFCTHSYDGPEWTLSLWDGQGITKVAQGREIQAQWNGGSGVYCSSG